MTIGDRVLACLHQAAESDAELARRDRTPWEGWCDVRRVSRWLAADGKVPGEETLRRALAQLARAGKVETREGEWRAAPA